MRKKSFIVIAAILALVFSTVSGAYATEYADGDIHFELKSQEDAKCILTMRLMDNLEEQDIFTYDLDDTEQNRYFTVNYVENEGESSFFKKSTDVQIEYNLEPVIGESELNVSVSAGSMAKVYDKGLDLYEEEDELYPLDPEKMTSQTDVLNLRIVRPSAAAYAAAAVLFLVMIGIAAYMIILKGRRMHAS
ncbi:MAG: hypothetical protein ACI4LC_07220 [Emergencia sp.]